MSVPDTHFAVDHRRFGDRAVVAVSGELDIATAPQLSAVLALALGSRPDELWIDLSAVTFIDSTALHVLFEAQQRFAGVLAVICPETVRRVLEIVGLAAALPLYDDVGAACTALESSGSRSRENSTPAVL